MTTIVRSSDQYALGEELHKSNPEAAGRIPTTSLAASITKEASLQTYLTIRYLVDDELVDDAFRAYAYFRWVDDTLDGGQLDLDERLSFLARQGEIIDRCYKGERPERLCEEERLIADLIANDHLRSHRVERSGLRIYIDQMMAVMTFDAKRKGEVITQEELSQYTLSLAMAVTEAMHYFIGHDDYSPQDETRYVAVTGAHITHMLRDALEDAKVGYFNMPKEFMNGHGIKPSDANHEVFRAWVRDQVKLARRCFTTGRSYMARVENVRCRLAGYAYIARFEVVLDAIEREGYVLREAYPERKTAKARLKMILAAMAQTIAATFRERQPERPGFQLSVETPK